LINTEAEVLSVAYGNDICIIIKNKKYQVNVIQFNLKFLLAGYFHKKRNKTLEFNNTLPSILR